MELDKFLPKNYNTEEWSIHKHSIFKKKIIWIPVVIEINNCFYIYLDLRIKREVLLVIKNAMMNDIKFYLISPLLSNSKIKFDNEELYTMNIENYLNCYSNSIIYDGVKKINFDLIGNLTDYCKEFNCLDKIKEIYLQVNINVQSSYKNWYNNELIYNITRSDIRDEFNSLYRDIQLSQILK